MTDVNAMVIAVNEFGDFVTSATLQQSGLAYPGLLACGGTDISYELLFNGASANHHLWVSVTQSGLVTVEPALYAFTFSSSYQY